ncbi:ABC transporter permease subunit, partial [Enterobacter cloacae]|uniref:ABC transporter permease subunit n=1 Tax=Enterobacter cloacae TaxID=550 RepID=UPI0013D10357
VVPLGLSGGLALALAARTRVTWIRILVLIEIDFFRAIPPLVLLIFVYSGLPFAGISLSPFASVCLA